MQARRWILLCALALLCACQSSPTKDHPLHSRDFEVTDVIKGDIDLVADINVRQSLGYLRELARKLYVRNPNQVLRGRHASQKAALNALFGPRRLKYYPSLEGKTSAAAISLALDASYPGDRVAAFIEGMRTMLLDAYGGKSHFYLHDVFDPQKLYFLARNFETAFWKLGHDRDLNGQLYLHSNSFKGGGDLSFERLAGKLIGLQDHMAQIVAETTNRQIKNVLQGVVSTVFFPI